ncbi:hypothetical protein [Streptomyces mirabilis]|uniref:hypothetical protein n=1 Tax=Streptomyces mirabilis TaxID=68239 RepID=UPI0036EF0231
MTSIIADLHDCEPASADARTVSAAQCAIVNRIGYDAWAAKPLAITAGGRRSELKVGDLGDPTRAATRSAGTSS